MVVIQASDRNTSWWAEPESNLMKSPSFTIEKYEVNEIEAKELSPWVLTSILSILVLSLLLSVFFQILTREKGD